MGALKRVAKFEKVSYVQFKEAIARVDLTTDNDEFLTSVYNAIKLPKRATSGSAGYDFFVPFEIELRPGESITIPTGIKVMITEGWVLKIYPRSSLGFKSRIQLDNTVAIIDSDYYNNETNEGHIIIKLSNMSHEGISIRLKAGTAFVQGVFLEYGVTEEDDVMEIRNGGLGSTSQSQKATILT